MKRERESRVLNYLFLDFFTYSQLIIMYILLFKKFSYLKVNELLKISGS